MQGEAQRIGVIDRLLARWFALRQAPLALVSQPEPRMVGQFARGQQMLAGNFLIEGELLLSPGAIPFEQGGSAAQEALHGFAWLDDLAAVGDARARKLAQAGVMAWITRYGRGAGPGWGPGLTGRRLIRWIAHALLLMQGMGADDQSRLLRAMAQHAALLSRRAGRAAPGLPRIEAHVGLLYAALSLEAMESRIGPASAAVLSAAERQIGPDGGVATRNPEELLQIFELLTWAAQALADHDRPVGTKLGALLDRVALALRALRHADGGLARFHGGGRGAEGVLAAALGVHDMLRPGQALRPPDTTMGYARLSAGRCTVIIDAARPPLRAAPARAHAATLAFELTSNRRAVIVSCGDGRVFGPDWHRASRATASHSTLAFEGYSSARFATLRKARLELAEGPRKVGMEFRHAPHARAVALSHDGYLSTHGLEHLRYLDLSADGRVLSGEDMLVAPSRTARRRFDEVLARTGGSGAPFALRFHLHPEADASLDMNGTAISIALRSGEIWVFRAGGLQIALAPSVYLEKGRLKPRPTQQIVLSSRATGYTSRLTWNLAKAQESPGLVRDLVQDEPLAVSDL